MKKMILFVSVVGLMTFASCGVRKKAGSSSAADLTATNPVAVAAYTLMDLPVVDISQFPKDEDGWITLFDGETLNGWRGYGADTLPSRWVVDDGAIKLNGSGGGEAHAPSGGDLVFAGKFKNFELTFEWKVAKGSNSGVFVLAQEVQSTDIATGKLRTEPIYISAPEYQVLDNANHPDAQLGKDGNRQSASLYDMIPAKPQNSNPFGEWNTGKIMVYKGTVVYGQNGQNVVEYHLWTPQWTDLLQASKFSEKAWPLAFTLLNDCGGSNHEGLIGLQDHGDDVWFRNIKIKILD